MRRLSRIPAPLWPSLQCQHSLFKKLSGSLEKNTSNHKINKLFDKIKNQSGIKQPLTWYSCGPTIYDHAHIGHARTYVCTDIIRRILEDYFQINVRFAMGMTDIDDKIITKGIEKGFKNWSEYLPMLHQFEDSFFSDLDALNVRRPDAVLRVTNHVEDIIRFISKLEQLGFAYSTSHGVYFDVKKLGSSYGKLGSIPPAESEETESEDVSNINNSSNDNNTDNISSNSSSSAHTTSKRHWRDFALWKTNKLGEPTWSSPWGSGRPGWHIECSAMTHAYFGDRLDIHSGGIDLKFPHHTNEIAQSEAHRCCPNGTDWVDTWLHTGHLYIEGRKMSKSLKNFITIRDFLSDGYGSSAPATDFRIFCLLHKYSASVHFSTEKIQEASLYRQRLTQFLSLCHTVEVSMTDRVTKSRPTEQSMQLHRAMDKYHTEIRALLEDDFDTPSVMRSLLYLVKEASVYAALLLGTDVHAFGTHPVEPLIQARGQILKILTLFGIDQSGLGVGIETNSSSKQHQQYMQQSSSVTLEKALDSLTQFRSRVRNQCLTEIKNIKKMKKEGNNTIANPSSSSSSPSSELLSIQGSMSSSNTSSNEALNSYERRLQSILTLCDQMRDDELVRMGVKIDDLNNTISTWKLIDTSPSHSSNIDNNDNRAS